MKTYTSLKNESFINRTQPDKVILNTNMCERIILKTMDLRDLLGETIFFSIPEWLRKEKEKKSVFLTGKITKISKSKLSIQLNFSDENWFPISQMTNVYLYKPKKPRQMLLTEYENE